MSFCHRRLNESHHLTEEIQTDTLPLFLLGLMYSNQWRVYVNSLAAIHKMAGSITRVRERERERQKEAVAVAVKVEGGQSGS